MLAAANNNTTNATDNDGQAATAKKGKKNLPSTRNKATTPASEDDGATDEQYSFTPINGKRKRAVSTPAAVLAAVEVDGGEEELLEEPKPKKVKARKGQGKKARSEYAEEAKEDSPIKADPEGGNEGEEAVDAKLFESAEEFLKEEAAE